MTGPARHAQTAWRAHRRANRLAHQDAAIHASQITECLRQLHYRTRQKPPTHPATDAAAPAMAIGEFIHRGLLPLLAQSWAEDPLVAEAIADTYAEPNPATLTTTVNGWPITATPDLRIIYHDRYQRLYELKTTGNAHLITAARRGRPRTGDVDQCLVGAVIAEHITGIPVRSIILDYLDTGDPSRRGFYEFPLTDAQRERGRTLIAKAAAAAAAVQAAPQWFGRNRSRALAPHSPCIGCVWRGQCLP